PPPLPRRRLRHLRDEDRPGHVAAELPPHPVRAARREARPPQRRPRPRHRRARHLPRPPPRRRPAGLASPVLRDSAPILTPRRRESPAARCLTVDGQRIARRAPLLAAHI